MKMRMKGRKGEQRSPKRAGSPGQRAVSSTSRSKFDSRHLAVDDIIAGYSLPFVIGIYGIYFCGRHISYIDGR